MMTFARLLLLCSVVSAGCAATITEKDRAAAGIRYDIGIMSFRSGDLRGALRELLAAVDRDPTLSDAHNALGLVFHAMGHREKALGHYLKAVELRPGFSEAHNNLGVLYLDMQRYDEAIAAFEVALSDILYGTPSLAEGNLGWAFHKKGDTREGVRRLRNAIATNAKFCRGYGWLAEIEMSQEHPEQVVAHGRRFQKYCVDDVNIAKTIPSAFLVEMQFRLGWGFAQINEMEKARELLSACADSEANIKFGMKCTRALGELE